MQKSDAPVKKIIIKKVNKGGHGGHHGGSWKVAYADFVTAMMALFLMLWLISAASKEQKEHLAGYFKEYTMFDYKGISDIPGTSMLSPPEHQSATVGDSEKPNDETEASLGKGGESSEEKGPTDEQIAAMVNIHITQKLGELRNLITVEIVDQGVKIEANYNEKTPLFDSGSTALTAVGQKVLSEIGNGIKGLPNKIAIEGHTDAIVYSGNDYTNWELSTDRASTARKILGQTGIAPERIDRVTGFAASRPLIKSNPKDPKNRRISILLLNMTTNQQAQGKK